jgi:hypothetical protein
MTIIEINTVIIAPCLVFVPAFIKCSKSGIFSIRTRLVTSGQRTPSKDSLPYIAYGNDQNPETRTRDVLELEFVTAAEGYMEPSKPPAIHHPVKTNVAVAFASHGSL